MKEPNALNDVAKFHETFGAPILEHPSIPDETRCALRVNLLQEELNELKEAIDNDDLVEIADALCDLQYVLSGAVLEFGLGEKFEQLFSEVQRSNMSKACNTMEEAKATLKKYKDQGTSCKIVEKGNVFVVYRTVDHKVLKNIAYSPANLKKFI